MKSRAGREQPSGVEGYGHETCGQGTLQVVGQVVQVTRSMRTRPAVEILTRRALLELTVVGSTQR